MIVQDFEAHDFEVGLPSDTELLLAFDLSQAATPLSNTFIAMLAPSMVS